MNSLFAAGHAQAQDSVSVLIVGAGPAGLSMAKALQNCGINPDIIEKENSIRSDGAGIAIPANGSWALEQLGIDVADTALHITSMQFTDDQGEVLVQEKISHIHNAGSQFLALSRDALMQRIVSSLDSSTHIQTGITVTKFSETDDKVCVEFSNGLSKSYDFVIGCDGIRSSLRLQAHPEEVPVFLGLLVWRTMIDATPDITMPTYILGSDKAALLYPMPNNKLYVYGHLFQSAKEMPSSSFSDVFSSFTGHMQQVVSQIKDQAPSPTYYIHHMEKSHSVRFIPDGFSRVLLVGDAAHAFGPMLQNGAAQAFEDAYVIQDLFAKGVTKAQIPGYITAFTKRRQERVEHIFTQSNAKIQSLSNPQQIQGRNEAIRKLGAPNVTGFKQFMKANP